MMAFLLNACSRADDRNASSEQHKPDSSSVGSSPAQAADPSSDTLLITADRLGRVHSCALLSEIRRAYPGSRDTLTPTEDPELNQAGVVVDLAHGERLLFGASWSDSSHAWTLSTTSPRFHTRGGLRVGSRYAKALASRDSIEFSFPEGQVVATLIPESVSFMVDDHAATVFFNRYADVNFAGPSTLLDSNARIVEFLTGRNCRK